MEIYAALHPETRPWLEGGPARQLVALVSLSCADDTARATAIDPRTMRRDATRGEWTSDDALTALRDTDADKGVVVDALAPS